MYIKPCGICKSSFDPNSLNTWQTFIKHQNIQICLLFPLINHLSIHTSTEYRGCAHVYTDGGTYSALNYIIIYFSVATLSSYWSDMKMCVLCIYRAYIYVLTKRDEHML